MKTTSRILKEKTYIPILKSQHWGRVLDAGSKIAPYRRYVSNDEYLTLDLDNKFFPMIVGNIETYNSELKFDLIKLIEVLEHVEDPWRAVKNCHDNLLENDGTMICSVPFLLNEHGDYHRWTREGLKMLFKDFKHVKIIAVGNFLTSSWGIFNFHNYFAIFNPIVAMFGGFWTDWCPNGFVIVAKKGG